MMWRLWHRLFGWHYVSINYGYSWHVRRVQTDGDGRPFATVCGMHLDLKWCANSHPWFPLTFPRAAVEEMKPGADVIVMPRKPLRRAEP